MPVGRNIAVLHPRTSSPKSAPSASPSSIAALPQRLDLSLYAGDDFAMQLTLKDASGQPVDLTGATAMAQIRPKPGCSIAAEFTCTVSSNAVLLNLIGTDTQTLVGYFVWDCQMTYANGVVQTIVAGRAMFTTDVTR